MLVVELTDDQMEQLDSGYRAVGRMADEGKPGMMVAQIYNGHMVVGLLDHDKSCAVQAALGGEAAVGKTARNAADRAEREANGPVCDLSRPWAEAPNAIELTGDA